MREMSFTTIERVLATAMGWLWLNATANLLEKGPVTGKFVFSLQVKLLPLTQLLLCRVSNTFI